MNITYAPNGDYLIPELMTEPPKPLGKYGRMRKNYLKTHRPILWNKMLLTGSLQEHLREIDRSANSRLNLMLPKMMEESGVTEQMKAENPLKWTAMMNSLKAQAEETILRELIYA